MRTKIIFQKINKKKVSNFVKILTDRQCDTVVIIDKKGYVKGYGTPKLNFNDNIFNYIESPKDQKSMRKAILFTTGQTYTEVEITVKLPDRRVLCHMQIIRDNRMQLYICYVWLKLQLFKFLSPGTSRIHSAPLNCRHCGRTATQGTRLYRDVSGGYICDGCLLQGFLGESTPVGKPSV